MSDFISNGNADREPGARPYAKMSARTIRFFWLVDGSSSMSGSKIESLNNAIRQAIPMMQSAAEENPTAKLHISTIKFADSAEWIQKDGTPIEDFKWSDINANGLTAMGEALDLITDFMEQIDKNKEKGMPPVVVLVTDGAATDDFDKALLKFNDSRWGNIAVRIAIAIGKDVEMEPLEEFIKNKNGEIKGAVLTANNSEQLANHIKFVSSFIIKNASDPNAKSLEKDQIVSTFKRHQFTPNALDDSTNQDDGDLW